MPSLLAGFTLSLVLSSQVPAPVPSHTPKPRPASPGPAVTVVARVNGVAIKSDRLAVAVNAKIPQSSFHRNVSAEKLAAIRREALDGLIQEELRYQEAVRLKIQLSAAEIEQGLERARRGYKDRAEFERARRRAGVTQAEFRAAVTRGLLILKAYQQVVRAKCGVAEAEAAKFYEQHPERFVMPEQLHVFLITIGVDPSSPRETWKKARGQAEDFARQIAAGASFEALARTASSDPSRAQGGDLGFIHRGRLADEFEAALRTMRPGQVSPVIQTIYGFHLMRLAEIRPPEKRSFEQVKQKLAADLTDERCAAQDAEWSQRLRAAATIQILQDAGDAEKANPSREP